MAYRHVFADGAPADLMLGKVVCVGRNYAAHARELNNTLPDRPLLFIKPSTAVIPFADELVIAKRFKNPHYEVEMSVLIGSELCCCSESAALNAVAGLGIGLDLTLRDLQNELKQQGHPWERAKAFDGSCVLSPFAPFNSAVNMCDLTIRLWRNHTCVQQGNTGQMQFTVLKLICEISKVFTLEAGDVVMTGTPEGVGQLRDGDLLKAELDDLVRVESGVTFK